MIVDLIADFLSDLVGDWNLSMHRKKNHYTVVWERHSPSAPEDMTFQLKAWNREDAADKVYRKIFSWVDRRSYLALYRTLSGNALVQVANTNRSGEVVGHLTVTEE